MNDSIVLSPAVYELNLGSVRSTNVYEERSLGIFRDDESVDEEEFNPTGSRATIWSRYLAMHMRKQLAFGEPYQRSLCLGIHPSNL